MKLQMNVQLLKQVIEAIKENPLNIAVQGPWVTHKDNIAPCETAGCIAGWALAGANLKKLRRMHDAAGHNNPFQERARKRLGLTEDQARRLFFVDDWPMPFQRSYYDAEERQDQTKITVRRIKHFIKTKGLE